MKNIRFLVLCLFLALNGQVQASEQPRFTLPKDLESKIVKTALPGSQSSLQGQLLSNNQNAPTNIPNIAPNYKLTGFNLMKVIQSGKSTRMSASVCAKPGCLDPNCGPNAATPY